MKDVNTRKKLMYMFYMIHKKIKRCRNELESKKDVEYSADPSSVIS